jgi:hypothetical protein
MKHQGENLFTVAKKHYPGFARKQAHRSCFLLALFTSGSTLESKMRLALPIPVRERTETGNV